MQHKRAGFGPSLVSLGAANWGKVLVAMMAIIMVMVPRLKGSTPITKSWETVEYRLFNLSLSIPKSFRAKEVSGYRVAFHSQKKAKREPAFVLEIYYFPAFLTDVGPDNLEAFLVKVWPEMSPKKSSNKDSPKKDSQKQNKAVTTQKLSGDYLSTIVAHLRQKPSFAGLSLEGISFRVRRGQAARRVVILHWRNGGRRFFVQANVLADRWGLYQWPLKRLLRGMTLLYRPERDRPRLQNLLSKLWSGKDLSQKNFVEPFFVQGHRLELKPWLNGFAGLDQWAGSFRQGRGQHNKAKGSSKEDSKGYPDMPRLQDWFFLDQDDLSQKPPQGLKGEDWRTLQDQLSRFRRTFTAGDVVAFFPGTAQRKGVHRLPWIYVIFKKSENRWHSYALGVEIPAAQGGEDSPKSIHW